MYELKKEEEKRKGKELKKKNREYGENEREKWRIIVIMKRGCLWRE